jgi:hypothetical protein
VPPNPKLFMLAYFLSRGQGLCDVGTYRVVNTIREQSLRKQTLRFHSSNGILGFAFSKLQFGKMKPFSSIIAVLITEATPDAPSRWPIFDLTEPMKRGCFSVRPSPKTVWRANASMGSPTVENS